MNANVERLNMIDFCLENDRVLTSDNQLQMDNMIIAK